MCTSFPNPNLPNDMPDLLFGDPEFGCTARLVRDQVALIQGYARPAACILNLLQRNSDRLLTIAGFGRTGRSPQAGSCKFKLVRLGMEEKLGKEPQ